MDDGDVPGLAERFASAYVAVTEKGGSQEEGRSSRSHPDRCPSRSLAAITLIELLVVITVILILLGLLLTGVRMLERQRQRLETIDLMKQLMPALESYLDAYTRLGNAADASDFVASPWTFLGRQPIAAGHRPFLDLPASRLACGIGSGPFTAGTVQTADQILDAFSAADHANHLIFVVMNQARNGRVYTDTIYIRSTAGTSADATDDIIFRYRSNPARWEQETYQASLTDVPSPAWP